MEAGPYNLKIRKFDFVFYFEILIFLKFLLKAAASLLLLSVLGLLLAFCLVEECLGGISLLS